MIAYIKLLRPHQWLKNLLLLFPPFFAGKLAEPNVVGIIIPAFAAFSLAASCSYIVNDIKDREADSNHETKKNRPIAKGEISVPIAIVIAIILYVFSMLTASSVSRRFEWFVMLYLLISFLYTFFLKDGLLYDIFFISFGFILRVVAGGEAFNIVVTNWLFLTVFTVSLMLAAGKRMGELVFLGDNAEQHRKSLGKYPPAFLEGILWFSASASLVMYSLYTIENKKGLFYTVPLAAFGLLRYIYIVKQGKGDPTDALLKDVQITAVGILWLVMIAYIMYH